MSTGILVSVFIIQFRENLLNAGNKNFFTFVTSNLFFYFSHILFCAKKKKIGIVGSLSIAIGLMASPVTITLCRRKSTRLLAVIGGLVLTLGCLFTSFAQQYHQVLFSYGKIEIECCCTVLQNVNIYDSMSTTRFNKKKKMKFD